MSGGRWGPPWSDERESPGYDAIAQCPGEKWMASRGVRVRKRACRLDTPSGVPLGGRLAVLCLQGRRVCGVRRSLARACGGALTRRCPLPTETKALLVF